MGRALNIDHLRSIDVDSYHVNQFSKHDVMLLKVSKQACVGKQLSENFFDSQIAEFVLRNYD